MVIINNGNNRGSFKGDPQGFVNLPIGSIFGRQKYKYWKKLPGRQWELFTELYYNPTQIEFDNDLYGKVWLKSSNGINGWSFVGYMNPTGIYEEKVGPILSNGKLKIEYIDPLNPISTINCSELMDRVALVDEYFANFTLSNIGEQDLTISDIYIDNVDENYSYIELTGSTPYTIETSQSIGFTFATNKQNIIDDFGGDTYRSSILIETNVGQCQVDVDTSFFVESGNTSNDNFVDARTIIVDDFYTFTFTASNVDATNEFGEPDTVIDYASSASIWFKWVSPDGMSGSVEFNTEGSSIDTQLAVFTGTELTNLNRVVENDDVDPDNGYYTSLVNFNFSENETYYIVVNGYDSEMGDIILNVTPSSDLAPVDSEFIYDQSGNEWVRGPNSYSGGGQYLDIYNSSYDGPWALWVATSDTTRELVYSADANNGTTWDLTEYFQDPVVTAIPGDNKKFFITVTHISSGGGDVPVCESPTNINIVSSIGLVEVEDYDNMESKFSEVGYDWATVREDSDDSPVRKVNFGQWINVQDVNNCAVTISLSNASPDLPIPYYPGLFYNQIGSEWDLPSEAGNQYYDLRGFGVPWTLWVATSDTTRELVYTGDGIVGDTFNLTEYFNSTVVTDIPGNNKKFFITVGYLEYGSPSSEAPTNITIESLDGGVAVVEDYFGMESKFSETGFEWIEIKSSIDDTLIQVVNSGQWINIADTTKCNVTISVSNAGPSLPV